MKTLRTAVLAAFCLSLSISPALRADNANFLALQAYFESVARARTESFVSGLHSLAGWEARRADIKARLLDEMGLSPENATQPPVCRVTGRIERADYVVENIILETAPGIYITGNLYLPRHGKGPWPVVLYQSGHSPNGPYGAKSHYKYHGVWLACHGIACFLMDTIQMSELKETHHGVFFLHRYDLYSRGYSPLDIEIFNARRALDWLVTRPEIDPSRIGATGRSGGGVTTFFLAAVDPRVRAAAPVSGECSTLGQVEGRLAEQHCDCMYTVNSQDILYSEIGALVAPRPFLICNAQNDVMYPLTYFNKMVENIGKVYSLYGAADSVGSATVPGPHVDVESIRLPVYAFFLKHLRGLDTTLTEHGPVDTLAAGQLLAFKEGYPLDERLTSIDRHFMPRAEFYGGPSNPAGRESRRAALADILRRKVFTFFPARPPALNAVLGESDSLWGRVSRPVQFDSFVRLNGTYSLPSHTGAKKLPAVLVLRDEIQTSNWDYTPWEGYHWGERAMLALETTDVGSLAIDSELRHQMIREANIIGRSLDAMRVYDILRGLEFLRNCPEVDPERITIVGRGAMGVNGLYAALLDKRVERVVLQNPTSSHEFGPCYLQVLRYTDIPEVSALLSDRLRLVESAPLELRQALAAARGSERDIVLPALDRALSE